MPRYEYRCEAEKHSFELRQGFDAEPVQTCPECGSRSPRVFHAPAVVFKGSGFYVNDYGKKSSTAGSSSASGNGKSSSSDDKSSSKKSAESKKESSTETSKAKASSDS